jgi:hypothetical protein
VVGSINVYARGKDVFGEHAVRLGSAFTQPAAVSLYNTKLRLQHRNWQSTYKRAMISRKIIDQAIGIVRSRTGGTADDTFNRPKRISQGQNIRMATAEGVLDESVRRHNRHSGPDNRA